MTVIERGSAASIVMTGDPGISGDRGEVKDHRPVRSFLSPDRGVCLTFVSSPVRWVLRMDALLSAVKRIQAFV